MHLNLHAEDSGVRDLFASIEAVRQEIEEEGPEWDGAHEYWRDADEDCQEDEVPEEEATPDDDDDAYSDCGLNLEEAEGEAEGEQADDDGDDGVDGESLAEVAPAQDAAEKPPSMPIAPAPSLESLPSEPALAAPPRTGSDESYLDKGLSEEDMDLQMVLAQIAELELSPALFRVDCKNPGFLL